MKVKKVVQHIEIIGIRERFTRITLEPMGEDGEDFRVIVERICREMASQRLPNITQLFGLGWSERLSLIVHDELVDGKKFIDQFVAEGNWAVWFYLWYTQRASRFALSADKTLAVPVSAEWGFWTFNPRTHTWQYDISSVSLLPPRTNISFGSLMYPPKPLHQQTCPRLCAVAIVAYLEQQLGNFLRLVASFGETRHVKRLSDFARHGLLTFGAVVDRHRPRILAYLPFAPIPAWVCHNFSADVEVVYSATVASRVDFPFGQPEVNVNLHFILRFPDEIRQRTAYLIQSLPFVKDCHDPYSNLVFITDIQFSLVGTIYNTPKTASTPVYLFVPPIPIIEHSKGMYSVRYPLVSPFFYWSFDPNGRHAISEDDWKTHDIPRLKVLSWIGASWGNGPYNVAHEYLQIKQYSSDGRQYAWERGHSVLVQGDPHYAGTVCDEDKLYFDSDIFSNSSISRPERHKRGSVSNIAIISGEIPEFVFATHSRLHNPSRKPKRMSQAESPGSVNGASVERLRKRRRM
ncbi:hypothetical protein PM082_022745 [Marasmius tenuissimus]|nr:hypothetical protein PM082_022745 [Marasmius tenuissimus]